MSSRWGLICILALSAWTTACGKPDLVITSGPPKVDLSQTGVPGGSLRLGTWTIKNQGSAPTAASGGWFTSGYYLSTDPVITTEDRELKGLTDRDTTDLEPGQAVTFSGDQEIAIPEDVQPGTYYFGILVDRSNRVAESDKANNFVSVRVGIVKELVD
jgi:subtilase family serine protease